MIISNMNHFLKSNKLFESQVNQEAGFSLLEILIAVAILATSLVSLMAAQGSAFLSSERGDDLTKATFLARERMAEVQIELEADLEKNKFPESEVEKEGTFEEPNEDFRWEYTLKKVEIPMVESGGGGGGDDSGGSSGNNPMVGNYMQQVMDQISKSVREVKVTVYWGTKEKKKEEQMQLSVTSHIVKLK